jgi:hypothetical protein
MAVCYAVCLRLDRPARMVAQRHCSPSRWAHLAFSLSGVILPRLHSFSQRTLAASSPSQRRANGKRIAPRYARRQMAATISRSTGSVRVASMSDIAEVLTAYPKLHRISASPYRGVTGPSKASILRDASGSRQRFTTQASANRVRLQNKIRKRTRLHLFHSPTAMDLYG